jgi:hypothetical protein
MTQSTIITGQRQAVEDGVYIGNQSEIQRLCLAKVITSGTWLRKAIINEARDPALAPALEIGLDKREIVLLCNHIEDEENLYRTAFTLILALIAFVWLASRGEFFSLIDWSTVGAAITLLGAACIVAGIRQARAEARLRQVSPHSFRRSGPTVRNGAQKFDMCCVGEPDQNVVLYRNFSPFDFAGIPLGGWSLVIDTEKRTSVPPPEAAELSIGELEHRIRKAVSNQLLSRAEYRELLVLNGKDSNILPYEVRDRRIHDAGFSLEQDPNIWWDKSARRPSSDYVPVFAPQVRLSAEQVRDVAAQHPEKARRYLWFAIAAFGEQIVLSYFLRIRIDKRILFVEHNRYLLGPVPDTTWRVNYRHEPQHDFTSNAARGLLFGPVELVIQPFLWIKHAIVEARWTQGGNVDTYIWAQRHGFQLNKGAAPSLRRYMMDDSFAHFYQKSDVDGLVKAVDVLILEELATSLEEQGIDVADLRNKETTIYNSGILVQSGDVTAQALAVGQGASAKTATTPLWPAPKTSQSS